jgi:hypothetical protein
MSGQPILLRSSPNAAQDSDSPTSHPPCFGNRTQDRSLHQVIPSQSITTPYSRSAHCRNHDDCTAAAIGLPAHLRRRLERTTRVQRPLVLQDSQPERRCGVWVGFSRFNLAFRTLVSDPPVVMQHLKGQPNIINLLGTCGENGHESIVMEYCRQGSLWSFLQTEKGRACRWRERMGHKDATEVDAGGEHWLNGTGCSM